MQEPSLRAKSFTLVDDLENYVDSDSRSDQSLADQLHDVEGEGNAIAMVLPRTPRLYKAKRNKVLG